MTETSNLQPDGSVVPPVTPEPPPPPGYEDPLIGSGLADTGADQPEQPEQPEHPEQPETD